MENMDVTSHHAAMHQTSPELWDFCWGCRSKSWQTQMYSNCWCYFCRWCGLTSVTEEKVWLTGRKLVWHCFGAKYETIWNHMSVHSNDLVLINQMKTRGEDLGAESGIVMAEDGGASQMFSQDLARVFLRYLFTGIYCWDRHDDTVACHQGRRCCYVWSIGVAERGSERSKTAESCQPWEGEEDSHRSGASSRGRIRGHSGQKAISNDGWWRLQEKRSYVLEKDRVEPDGLRPWTH